MNWHPIKPLLGPNKYTKWKERKKLSKISGLKLKLVLLSRTRDRLKSSKKWLWQFFKPCVRIFSATSDQSAANSPKKKWIQAAQVKPKSSKATKHSRSIPLSWQCDQSPITFRHSDLIYDSHIVPNRMELLRSWKTCESAAEEIQTRNEKSRKNSGVDVDRIKISFSFNSHDRSPADAGEIPAQLKAADWHESWSFLSCVCWDTFRGLDKHTLELRAQ